MKAPSVRNRWTIYALAMVATVLAMRGIGGAEQSSDVAAPAKPVDRVVVAARDGTPSPRETAPELDVARLGARTSSASRTDLFSATDWDRKAHEEELRRNPPKALPPPPPQAPPLPFRYLGKMIEDGRTTAFIVSGERNLIVREGDTLQDVYRVERIEEQSMTFTYLPLKQTQVLSFNRPAAPAAPTAAAPQRPPEDD